MIDAVMSESVQTRRGIYHDSVTLLRIAQTVSGTPGITAAQVAMATDLNVELTRDLGFEIPDGIGPNDLLIALRGADDDAIAAGLAAAETALAATGSVPSSGFGSAPAPRTVRTAAAAAPDASVVLLSVPGGAVIGEAMDAIAAGRHLMIFSDNVPIEHEIAIKDAAAAAGVLVMGPDCGTAVIGGVGLGFANVLRTNGSGPRVGVVAASGTGAQHLTCLLDDAGVAISHVLGLGGRDLSEKVGGRSALAALSMLDADPGTDHIVVISKPPHPSAAEKVSAAADSAQTPVTMVMLGADRPDITAAAETVLAAVGTAVPTWRSWGTGLGTPDGRPGALRGLYAGGTLADEAMLVVSTTLGDIRSNIPLRPDLALADTGSPVPSLAGVGHAVVDLGDDAFTRGRPHPMIDPTVRLDLLAAQAADPEVRVVLMDVVLGHGAEADPAARLAPAIRAAREGRDAAHPLDVVIAICGTDADPQGRARQAEALAAAGATVHSSNAAAARSAASLAAGAVVAVGKDS